MDDFQRYGSEQETKDQAVARLAKLSPIEFDRVKQTEAEALGCGVTSLASEVKAEQSKQKKRAAMTPDAEAWLEEVDGDALLDDLCRALRHYIVIDEKHLHTLALWAVHTHCFQHWQYTPRLHVSAPKKRSGKSRVLDVLEQIVARPLSADGLTAAVVFRLTEDNHPTLLADEIDQWLDQKSELIGILNSGHSKGKKAYRCVGDEHQVKEFDVFSPLALAGIGKIKSDTLADRSIKITIRRRLKSEPISRFRKDRATEFGPLRQQIVRWVADHKTDLADHDPKIPGAVDNDRLIDNWFPLLAIADVAGGEWPERARQIMLHHHTQDDVGEEDGWDILLLKDLKDIFEETEQDRLFTKDILTKLHLMTERPWPEYPNKQGPTKAITDRQVARLLEPHDIKPKPIRISGLEKPSRGYERSWFEETWDRYVCPPENPVASVTPLQPAGNCGTSCNAHDARNVTDIPSVTENPRETAACNGVTDKTPPNGDAQTYQPDEEDLEADLEERLAIQNEPPADPFDIPIPPAFDRRRSAMGNSST